MKKKNEVIKKLIEVLEDERFWYKTATISINAPLALIQLDLGTRAQTLGWILGIGLADIKKLWKEKRSTKDFKEQLKKGNFKITT